MLEYSRALIACRKRFPALGNCRKDLVRVDVDERRRLILVERGDPSGDAAMLICNLDRSAQEIPLRADCGGWDLALYSEALEFTGRKPEVSPPARIPPPSAGPPSLTLPAASAALYTGFRPDRAS
jgi:hypothetical protein